MSTKLEVQTDCNMRCSYLLIFYEHFYNESVMSACLIHMGYLKRNKLMSYVNFNGKNIFFHYFFYFAFVKH